MNSVRLIGNVGKTAQIKETPNSKIATFSLATNETYTNQNNEEIRNTTWHNVVAWGKLAEECEGLIVKGKFVNIEGKLNTRSYKNKSDQTVYVTEVVALKVNEVQAAKPKERMFVL
jgi:single-strand DNA-binding protein